MIYILLVIITLWVLYEYHIVKEVGLDLNKVSLIILDEYDFAKTKTGKYLLPHRFSSDYIGKIHNSLVFSYYHDKFGLIIRGTKLSRELSKIVKISMDPNAEILK